MHRSINYFRNAGTPVARVERKVSVAARAALDKKDPQEAVSRPDISFAAAGSKEMFEREPRLEMVAAAP